MAKSINQLFFELIQVAISTRICLSHTPSADEWGELYAMAKKQSLVGVCFAGVQKLQTQSQEPPEMLYLTWMGMAAKIQQRNENLNKQCVELQERLAADGYDSCILKGQGVAQLYDEGLRALRQSGDIDVWLSCSGSLEDRRTKIISYARKFDPNASAIVNHVECNMLDGIEVELHYVPAFFYNPFINQIIIDWTEKQAIKQMKNKLGNFISPDVEFNAVYLLVHIYKHLLSEGVGLRQLMDYYFVLRKLKDSNNVSEIRNTIHRLGMDRIASAVMWVMKIIFELDDEYLFDEPNEKEGKLLLSEVIEGGNFGHFDKRTNHKQLGIVGRTWKEMRRKQMFVMRYPSEILWVPYWKVWHWFLRRKLNRIN